jgi:hypothetical protein
MAIRVISQNSRSPTYWVWHIVGNSLAKNRSCQFTIHFFCIQIVILTVEEQTCGVRSNEVSERFANHCETEHWAILRQLQTEQSQHYTFSDAVKNSSFRTNMPSTEFTGDLSDKHQSNCKTVHVKSNYYNLGQSRQHFECKRRLPRTMRL